MITTCWACSVTIFSKGNLPAVIYDYSYLFHPQKYRAWILEQLEKKHVIFKTAISCCIKEGTDTYCFMTDLYPVYTLMNKYIEVYGLDFCTIKYIPGW